MKIDPYKHKQKYLNWKEKVSAGIPDISQENSAIILRYLSDMECGLNVSNAKGARSFIRLNNLRQRMIFLARLLDKQHHISLVKVSEEQVFRLFNDMRNGTIRRRDGGIYRSVGDYVNPFKAFWHWHMKVNRKKSITIPDITQDLDASTPKPQWVYLTEDQVRKLSDNAKYEYKVLILFLFDSGIRSPVELINIRVSDLYDKGRKLHIRQEIVKKGSFGRKINLMLSAELVHRYVRDKQLGESDQLFKISPPVVNRYLQRLARRTLGDGVSLAGEKYANLTMYDFRHCSCCYWLPRYKSESALKYRFGWKKSDKIHYYSELLGMKDTISQEDMLLDLTKTELERRLLKNEQDNKILREKIQGYNSEIAQVKALLKIYMEKLRQLEQRNSQISSPRPYSA